MSTFGSSIISVYLCLSLVCGPNTALGKGCNPEERISKFNEEVSLALARGETWPCNPINQARKWFGRASGDSMASNQFSCSSTAGESVAIVSVRDTQAEPQSASCWAELRFERPNNKTWRLTSVEIIPSAPMVPLVPSPSGRHVGVEKINAHEPNSAEGLFKNYSVKVGGIRMDLKNQVLSSIGCGPKENGAPVGQLSTNLPSPHSIPQTGFCVFEPAEIAITVLNKETSESLTFPFGRVEPSQYMIELEWNNLGPGGFVLQVWCNSWPTSIKFVRVG